MAGRSSDEHFLKNEFEYFNFVVCRSPGLHLLGCVDADWSSTHYDSSHVRLLHIRLAVGTRYNAGARRGGHVWVLL